MKFNKKNLIYLVIFNVNDSYKHYTNLLKGTSLSSKPNI